jgi:hypothetical protein
VHIFYNEAHMIHGHETMKTLSMLENRSPRDPGSFARHHLRGVAGPARRPTALDRAIGVALVTKIAARTFVK